MRVSDQDGEVSTRAERGNTGTWTDTTTKSCTNTVLPADGTAYTVVGVKYFPRDIARAAHSEL